VLTGQYAGYTNTAKGSTWEGGIRVPSFVHWKGMIPPYSRSAEVISSMDVFPTLTSLAGMNVPKDIIMDGKDMSDILLDRTNQIKTKHEFLFHYGTCHLGNGTIGISAVRHGKYKAHFCTSPGLGGNYNLTIRYEQYPLLFDVDQDPSESIPISVGLYPQDNKEHQEAMDRIMRAYAMEMATFEFGTIVPEPDGPGEGPNEYGLCCERSRDCNCREGHGSDAGTSNQSLFNMGTKRHHDLYHSVLGEKQPSPFVTMEQAIVNAHEEESRH
jgi:hypothetical protein